MSGGVPVADRDRRCKSTVCLCRKEAGMGAEVRLQAALLQHSFYKALGDDLEAIPSHLGFSG